MVLWDCALDGQSRLSGEGRRDLQRVISPSGLMIVHGSVRLLWFLSQCRVWDSSRPTIHIRNDFCAGRQAGPFYTGDAYASLRIYIQ